MSPLAGLAAVAGAVALAALRPNPGPNAKFWEENFFDDRFFLFMYKTSTVFDPDFVGEKRGGKPVWDFRITDELNEAAFSGRDTFSIGRAASIRWAIARQNRPGLEGSTSDFGSHPDILEIA